MTYIAPLRRHDDYLLPTGGETVLARKYTTRGDISIGSGTLKLMFMRARRSAAITKLQVGTGTTAGSAHTLFRVCVYDLTTDGTGAVTAGTLIHSSASDTTGLTNLSTATQRTLSTTWNKVEGKLYAVGFLNICSGSPLWEGTFSAIGSNSNLNGGLLTGSWASQADLPASFVIGDLTTSSTSLVQVAALP